MCCLKVAFRKSSLSNGYVFIFLLASHIEARCLGFHRIHGRPDNKIEEFVTIERCAKSPNYMLIVLK